VIELALDGVLEAIARGAPFGAGLVLDVRSVALPALGKVRLGFTDASPLAQGDPRTVFVAAAEDTDDPYLDGACAGSAIGLLDEEARVAWLEPLEGRHKVEGVAVEPGGDRALLVADPDDSLAARAAARVPAAPPPPPFADGYQDWIKGAHRSGEGPVGCLSHLDLHTAIRPPPGVAPSRFAPGTNRPPDQPAKAGFVDVAAGFQPAAWRRQSAVGRL
jgi:hypothetical protein